MTLQELVGRFEDVRRISGNSYQCKCPVHEDKKASLTISEKNNTLLLCCHAGCDAKNILRAVGLTFKDIGNAVDKMQRYKKIKSEYQKYYGKIPTDREMSAFMGMDEESLKSIKKAAVMGQIRSLDEPINSDGEDIYIGDTIA